MILIIILIINLIMSFTLVLFLIGIANSYKYRENTIFRIISSFAVEIILLSITFLVLVFSIFREDNPPYANIFACISVIGLVIFLFCYYKLTDCIVNTVKCTTEAAFMHFIALLR